MGNKNSGPRPSPHALKVLRGTTRKDRLNPEEPQPSRAVEKPATLSQQASEIWDRLAPVVLDMGTLTAADVPAFARLCELQATSEMASGQKRAEGFAPFVLSEDYNGAPVVKIHAALKLERETATAIRPFYDYFGMTPTGRARIRVPERKQPKDDWAALGIA